MVAPLASMEGGFYFTSLQYFFAILLCNTSLQYFFVILLTWRKDIFSKEK
jgi:hypothetical protein